MRRKIAEDCGRLVSADGQFVIRSSDETIHVDELRQGGPLEGPNQVNYLGCDTQFQVYTSVVPIVGARRVGHELFVVERGSPLSDGSDGADPVSDLALAIVDLTTFEAAHWPIFIGADDEAQVVRIFATNPDRMTFEVADAAGKVRRRTYARSPTPELRVIGLPFGEYADVMRGLSLQTSMMTLRSLSEPLPSAPPVLEMRRTDGAWSVVGAGHVEVAVARGASRWLSAARARAAGPSHAEVLRGAARRRAPSSRTWR